MTIKQQIDWDGKKYYGFVDISTELDDDSLLVAREALVHMINTVNINWKLPVWYFLIAGLGSHEHVNLVQQCLAKLHSVGVKVLSLTFDDLSTNAAMIRAWVQFRP